jgi:hypothetical protein
LGCTDFPHFLQLQGHHTEPIRKVDFQDRLDIIVGLKGGKMFLNALNGKCQLIDKTALVSGEIFPGASG